jgi:GxxExxY protein
VLYQDLTNRILGCLVTVHTALGPGLPERSYHVASALEFAAMGVPFVREPVFTVRYRNVVVGNHKPDFIIEGKVILELKCVAAFDPVHTSQVLTYLRVSGLKVALLVNFNVPTLKTGIKRIVL